MEPFVVNDVSELEDVAGKILHTYPTCKLFTFQGSMGAGKTTLIKFFCKKLQVKDNTSSPTFSVVNEYETANGEKIYHFDFYRIKEKAEFFDIGYEDYLYSNAYCFIEWPENAEGLIPENALKINIALSGKERIISCFTDIRNF